jgi:hypothetical protein
LIDILVNQALRPREAGESVLPAKEFDVPGKRADGPVERLNDVPCGAPLRVEIPRRSEKQAEDS